MTKPDLPERSDEELARFVAREPGSAESIAAADELFGRYSGRVYVWCLQSVRDHDRALDLAQDVMLRAVRALGGFEGRSKFSSWLFAIARNRCRTAVTRRPLLVDDAVDPDDLAAPRRPDEAYEELQSEERVLALIREVLDPIEQTALWMRCFEDVPVDDITRALGITAASGARGVLQTARRKLQAALDRARAREEGTT